MHKSILIVYAHRSVISTHTNIAHIMHTLHTTHTLSPTEHIIYLCLVFVYSGDSCAVVEDNCSILFRESNFRRLYSYIVTLKLLYYKTYIRFSPGVTYTPRRISRVFRCMYPRRLNYRNVHSVWKSGRIDLG